MIDTGYRTPCFAAAEMITQVATINYYYLRECTRHARIRYVLDTFFTRANVGFYKST